LENEADFEITDKDGWQAIHAAAAWGHVSFLLLLLVNGLCCQNIAELQAISLQ
jgi:hypothetical protein